MSSPPIGQNVHESKHPVVSHKVSYYKSSIVQPGYVYHEL